MPADRPVVTPRMTVSDTLALLRDNYAGARILMAEDTAINREVALDLIRDLVATVGFGASFRHRACGALNVVRWA